MEEICRFKVFVDHRAEVTDVDALCLCVVKVAANLHITVGFISVKISGPGTWILQLRKPSQPTLQQQRNVYTTIQHTRLSELFTKFTAHCCLVVQTFNIRSIDSLVTISGNKLSAQLSASFPPKNAAYDAVLLGGLSMIPGAGREDGQVLTALHS